jgi:hypothetical protein
MDQERAMMIFLSYQKLRMPTFSVRQRRTENPLRERLLVRKFIAQLETYYFYQQQQQQVQWQYYKEQETMTSTNTEINQQDEQISQMDVDREIDEQNEEETSNITDSSTSEDEDDSVCSIVMSTSDNNNNSSVSLDTSDLIKNYALMLEVPTTLTTTNDQI